MSNNLVQLKGQMLPRGNPSKGGGASLSKNQIVSTSKIDKLKDDMKNVKTFWSREEILGGGALVSVYYERIVPKSRRVSKLLSVNSESSNESIVGAKFGNDSKKKHIITHYLSYGQIDIILDRMEKCRVIVDRIFDGKVDDEKLKRAKSYRKRIEKAGLAMSTFCSYIVDLSNIERFGVLDNSSSITDDSIITIYDTKNDIDTILNKLDINISNSSHLGKNTILLNSEDILKLKAKAPYLIAMSVSDIADYEYINFKNEKEPSYGISIPTPKNEPVVGVIDTLFSKDVYFSDWVTYEDWVDKEIPRDAESYTHGTAITSIIVDGPAINPELDDGCGRFRVKHFGVAVKGKNSSSSIIRSIKSIVESNKDIKVWNISLGAQAEINPNFISPEAALLDEIQYKNDVVFIVAGTNKPDGKSKDYKIGSPADSINALVVNAVDEKSNIASYARRGKVLSFFNKPDLSYFGGDKKSSISACTATGLFRGVGTSFATPWITRKMAYLIGKMGLTREIAKALLVDSAIKWQMVDENRVDYLGFGVVPQRIEDIISTDNDEIRFYVEGISSSYETYSHRIPIPLADNRYPFHSRATLCYFPECTRNQGVDYTNTELDIYFGRIQNNEKISSINNNNQSNGNDGYINEEGAREYYRKWDNTKHIKQEIKSRSTALRSYNNKLWGLSIKSKNRLTTASSNIKFGVVVTLKEINGNNRYDDFIKMCSVNGWIVNEIKPENIIEVFETANAEIKFE